MAYRLFGGFWQARHPPRYAAFLRPSSPSFPHSSGQEFANRIRRRRPPAGDKWHLDEVAIKIAGVQHWLWRAVDQNGMVLDVLVQSRRDKRNPSPKAAWV